MAKVTSSSIGDGITRRSVRLKLLDGSEDDHPDIWREFLKGTTDQANQPWGHHPRLIAGLRARLAELERRLPDDEVLQRSHYQPHVTELWYVLEAVRRANLIEKYISTRPWEAVSLAYELGELVTELAFKLDLEREALAGMQVLAAQGEGAKQRRKQSPEERTQFVEGLVESGSSKRAAFASAGRHFQVSASMIKKDYYRK